MIDFSNKALIIYSSINVKFKSMISYWDQKLHLDISKELSWYFTRDVGIQLEIKSNIFHII